MVRDIGVTVALHERLPGWAVGPVSRLSALGQPFVLAPALVVLYVLEVVSNLRRSGGESGQSLCSDRTAFVIATVLGGMSLGGALKSAFGMTRPPEELYAGENSEYGFPSGHTMAATVFWGALALWSTAGRRSTRLLAAGLIVAAVAASRLATGAHYAVDVAVSVALGAIYLAAVARITGGRPGRAFCVAIGSALLAIATSGGDDRALLATGGTVTAAAGWLALEFRPVRRLVVRAAG